MQKHWLHPLNILVVLSCAVTILVWPFLTFYYFEISWSLMEGSTGLGTEGWNWAHMISAALWVTGFSVGLVGAAVNLSNFLRFRYKKAAVKDFSLLKSLSEDEVEELELWLNTNTYGSEYLKELWGERM